MNKIWFLVEDGLTGTENQLKALEARMRLFLPDMQSTWHKIQRGSWLFPRMDAKWYWDSEESKPDLVLASGRLAILPALDMKTRGARVAFIQDPVWMRSKFDMIYCAVHDKARGTNVLNTDGTLTRIGQCVSMPESNTVLLIIGGARKGKNGTLKMDFIDRLSGKKLLVTFSRRTPPDLKQQVMAALPCAEFYDPAEGGENPYLTWLCRAEIIMATNDSTGMICDAASTGRSVYILPYVPATGRLKAFHEHMIMIGAARMFTGDIEKFTPHTILNDADKVAKDIAGRFFAR